MAREISVVDAMQAKNQKKIAEHLAELERGIKTNDARKMSEAMIALKDLAFTNGDNVKNQINNALAQLGRRSIETFKYFNRVLNLEQLYLPEQNSNLKGLMQQLSQCQDIYARATIQDALERYQDQQNTSILGQKADRDLWREAEKSGHLLMMFDTFINIDKTQDPNKAKSQLRNYVSGVYNAAEWEKLLSNREDALVKTYVNTQLAALENYPERTVSWQEIYNNLVNVIKNNKEVVIPHLNSLEKSEPIPQKQKKLLSAVQEDVDVFSLGRFLGGLFSGFGDAAKKGLPVPVSNNGFGLFSQTKEVKVLTAGEEAKAIDHGRINSVRGSSEGNKHIGNFDL
ncbi:MAG: hypothetical protein K0Q74_145 [Gammaproteobacteria bacterium]|jgi:hypothetical protein|nr:hypothetical protein [Gammaproteobacteria bacterium]